MKSVIVYGPADRKITITAGDSIDFGDDGLIVWFHFDRANMRELIERLRRPHLIVDGDCFFSCPKSRDDMFPDHSACCDESQDKNKCNCGADQYNMYVNQLLEFFR